MNTPSHGFREKISILFPSGRKYEATQKITSKLRDGLTKEKFDITSEFVKNAEIYHIFSNGFREAVRYKKVSSKAIYSLLTNMDFSTKRIFLWFKEEAVHEKRKNHLFQIAKIALSSFIPLILKRKAIAQYAHVTVPTNYLKRTLGIRKAKVIPIGVDTNKFRKIKEGEGVAFFGSPAGNKGYRDFFNATKELDKSIPIRFYFSSKENWMRTLFKENIEILGPQRDMVKAYNENNIVVLPFRSKNASLGIPLTLLESMACERAIITTNFPHVKEVASNSVLYVDSYSPKQIAEKIETLHEDPHLCKKLGKRARKRVLENYSEEHMIRGFSDLYTEILKNR